MRCKAKSINRTKTYHSLLLCGFAFALNNLGGDIRKNGTIKKTKNIFLGFISLITIDDFENILAGLAFFSSMILLKWLFCSQLCLFMSTFSLLDFLMIVQMMQIIIMKRAVEARHQSSVCFSFRQTPSTMIAWSWKTKMEKRCWRWSW